MNKFNAKRTWGPEPRYPEVLKRGCLDPDARGSKMIVVAGPCSVESEEQIDLVVPYLASNKVTYARGGVYRAGTYPGDDFGFKAGLALRWSADCRSAGLQVVMEVLDIRQLESMAGLSDAFQVGARHMQDYALLKEVSGYRRPVFLKRHPGSTLDEFLGAAEYLARGVCNPVLVERGSSSFMNHVRWELSVSTIAAIQKMTHMPVIVDASHGSGRRDLVEPLTLAGIAAGAHGFIVEVHPDPEKSMSDADQAYPMEGLGALMAKAKAVGEAIR